MLCSIWAGIPKVVGSGIFFKLARCGYTLRVTSQASYYTVSASTVLIIYSDCKNK
jgi:hypothetical protein